jgi:hypothetical protein
MRHGIEPEVYAYPKFVFYFVFVEENGFAVLIYVSLSLGLPYGFGITLAALFVLYFSFYILISGYRLL